jgi:hypothetical protein
MKYIQPRPLADPDAAAQKLLEIANAVEAVQDGRIHVEKINEPFLRDGGSPAEWRRAETRDRVRLAVDARERDLCEVHSDWRRAVCIVPPNGTAQGS